METGLIDINQRIECFVSDVGYRDRSNSRHDDYYRHPFFQYREIIPSLPSSLINIQLNKRSLDQGEHELIGAKLRILLNNYILKQTRMTSKKLKTLETLEYRKISKVFESRGDRELG